jgi:hypothetical protein
MKDYLKLTQKMTPLEKYINDVVPMFTFINDTLKEKSFVNSILRDVSKMNMSFENMSLKEKTILITLGVFMSPYLLISKNGFEKYDNWFFKKVIFNKERKNRLENLLSTHKEDIDKYKKYLGKDSILIKFLENGLPSGERFKHMDVQAELTSLIESKVEESYEFYKKNEDEFINYYAKYNFIRKEEEAGCKYFTLLLNNHIRDNLHIKEDMISKKAKILPFNLKK